MEYTLIIDQTRKEEVVVTAHAPNRLTEEIENLVLTYGGKDHLTVYTEDERMLLHYSEIECVTVIDRKLYAIGADGKKYRLKCRLWEVESGLPTYFVRINKSTVANQHRIARFHTSFSGAVDAVFRSGYKDYVSRRCFADLKRRLEK